MKNIITHSRSQHLLAVVGMALGLLGTNVYGGNTPAVKEYLIAKGVHYMQAGPGAPALGTNGPYQAMASVEPVSATSVTSVSLLIPGGDVLTLTTNDYEEQWEVEDFFATKALLDAAAPVGSYKFTIVGNDGTHMPTLVLGADAYPNTPRVSNWAALQNADSAGDIVITWDPFTGGTANDFVQVNIEDEMGNGFSTGGPGAPGSLNGTNTSVVIPASALAGGTQYSGTLLFAHASINTTAYPGVQGIAAYYKETSFSLSTTSAPPAAGRFRFAQANYSVSEDGLGVVLTVLRSGGSSGSASVLVTTRPGTAVPGSDYGSLSNVIDFADGVESVDVPLIQIVDHPTLDGNKTFFATLSSPMGGADIGAPAETTVTILDTEIRGAGTFGFSALIYTVSEALTNVAVVITRSGGSSGVASIVYTTISGSAEAGDDFTQAEGFLTFSNGVTSRTVNIPITRDAIDETNETFSVSLFNPTGGAALSEHDTAVVVIRDDDTAGVISFSAATYSVTESDTNFPVVVRRTGGGADEVSVDLVITGGTATRGEDYDRSGGTSVTLNFGPGQMAVTNIFAIHEDTSADGDETVLLTLRNVEGGARLVGVTNATLRILDDEVTLQFSASSYTNKETAGAAVIFVERTGPLTVPASVHVRTSGGSARPGVDYVPTNVVVNFAVGARKKPVVIRLINDYLVEDPESIELVLEDPSENALLGPRAEASVLILSEDLGGVIEFGTATLNVVESRPFLSVVVIRTGGLASNVTVHLATSEMSAHDAEDYVGTNTTLTFVEREKTKTIRIPILPDTIVEGLETFALNLTNPTGGATLGGRSGRIAVILDDDVGGVISFARPEIVVNENGTNAVVIVNRVGGAASEVTVRLAAADGTATDPDYVAFDDVLTFAAGERSKTNLILINNDQLAEGAVPETILLSLREFHGGGRPGVSNAVIRIVDDESSVSFTNETATVVEGKTLTVTVLRGGALDSTGRVDFMTMDGTAVAGTNYTATNGTLVFPPRVAARSFTIRVLSSTAFNAGQTFDVILKNPQGVLLGLKTNITVTLADHDAVPVALGNLFTFKVDGTNYNASTHVTGSFQPGSLEVSSLTSSLPLQMIELRALEINAPGMYHVPSPTFGSVSYQRFGNGGGTYTTGEGGGTVIIDVLDTETRVFTGRFDFIMSNLALPGSTVHIEGQFRYHYPLPPQ